MISPAQERKLGESVVRQIRASGGYLDDVGPRLTKAFLDRGLLLRPLGNVLYLMPPYVITEAETVWAIEQIEQVLSALPVAV